jgi:AcrR family transcriptional regulator
MEESRRPPGKLRTQYSGLVRDSVLTTARRLFNQNGYVNTSVRQLAEEAGVAVQTIYSTFGSKEGILLALLELVDQDQSMEGLRETMATSQDPAVIADTVAKIHRRLFETYGDIVTLAFQQAESDGQLVRLVEAIRSRRRASVERVCHRLVALGILKTANFEAAASHLELLSREETYEFLKSRGWSLDAYEDWLRQELLVVMLNH